MNARIADVLLIAFAAVALGVAGAMDMHDAEMPVVVPALECRDKLFLRVALTADEAAGRCDQLKEVRK